jgi:hypothetical protein
MFISIRRYSNVRSVSEVCRKIELSFVPLLRRAPGFIAYYAVDGGGGAMATVSVFSTAGMAEESNTTAAAWLKENAADLQPEAPDIVSGKALVSAFGA